MLTLIMMMALSSPAEAKPLTVLTLPGEDQRGMVFAGVIKQRRNKSQKITQYGTQMWVTIRVFNADITSGNEHLPALCQEIGTEAINREVHLGYSWGFYKLPRAVAVRVHALEVREAGWVITCQVLGLTVMRDNKQGK